MPTMRVAVEGAEGVAADLVWPPRKAARGSSSISSKPQMVCLQLDGLWNSVGSARAADLDHRWRSIAALASCHSASISSMLASAGDSAALGQLALRRAEARAELGVGLAQRLLGIHLDEARQVHQHEQQVAQFVFELHRASRRARASSNSRELFVRAFRAPARHCPNRSRRRRRARRSAAPPPAPAGRAAPAQQTVRFASPFACFLFGLDLAPDALHVARGLRGLVAEDVRMAADQLLR